MTSNTLAGKIIALCGRGRVLDVSVGSDWLSRTLLERGLEVQRLDEMAGANSPADPSRILPVGDESCETIVSVAGLERLGSSDVRTAVRELHRVTRRFAFVQLPILIDRDRGWWEATFYETGFRRHPLFQTVVGYEDLEYESTTLAFFLEKIPAVALAEYPLDVLKVERDLHMDMLREPGRRADAHLARYTLARQYVRPGDVVLDAACGLGYGSAVMAHGAPGAHVIGIDCSAYAVDYARASFCPVLPNVEFKHLDVCRLESLPDSGVDLVVSFETLEHLPAPEGFLREVRRVLKPGGRFIASVPNQWIDATGRDPNPWHFHVFDFGRLAALCEPFLAVEDVYRQTAGGGMTCHDAPRALRRVQLPVTNLHEQAEWWLVSAQVKKARSPKTLPAGQPNTIVALTRHPEHPLFASWLADAPFPVDYAIEAGLDYDFPAHTALVVAVDTYHEPNVSLLRRAVEQGLPTLILADGILEYRNTWEHPQLMPGSMFQPLLGHKIACLGRSQARILESWGNAGRCEIVGAPRFDRYANLKRRTRSDGAPYRVLVMTALTPSFTEEQHLRVRQSLIDVKNFFAWRPTFCDAPVEVIWRVTKGLDVEIGVASEVSDLTGRELAEVLQQVDAVITTPSTSMLEAMLLGLPVATLDYCNCPAYVPTAWRISGPEQIAPTIGELLNPAAARMLFQETTLHDALECARPATPRLLQLASEMIAHGWNARRAREPLQLPARLIEPAGAEAAIAENRFQLHVLYPAHTPFRETNLSALQVEVGHLREYAAGLEQQVRDLRADLSSVPRVEPPALPEAVVPQPPAVEPAPEHAFDFLEHLPDAKLLRGAAEQFAEWGVSVDGKLERTVFLQPPAEVLFEIPVGDAGQLRTAIMQHPDVWDRPEAGGCEFYVRVDGRVALVVAQDPSHTPADRRWHEVLLDVPASASGRHRVTIETRAVGSTDFRWAICREPRFTWSPSVDVSLRLCVPQSAA